MYIYVDQKNVINYLGRKKWHERENSNVWKFIIIKHPRSDPQHTTLTLQWLASPQGTLDVVLHCVCLVVPGIKYKTEFSLWFRCLMGLTRYLLENPKHWDLTHYFEQICKYTWQSLLLLATAWTQYLYVGFRVYHHTKYILLPFCHLSIFLLS